MGPPMQWMPQNMRPVVRPVPAPVSLQPLMRPRVAQQWPRMPSSIPATWKQAEEDAIKEEKQEQQEILELAGSQQVTPTQENLAEGAASLWNLLNSELVKGQEVLQNPQFQQAVQNGLVNQA